MINRTQFKASLYLGFFISLIRLVFLLLDQTKGAKAELQTMLVLFHTNAWFVPILFAQDRKSVV